MMPWWGYALAGYGLLTFAALVVVVIHIIVDGVSQMIHPRRWVEIPDTVPEEWETHARP